MFIVQVDRDQEVIATVTTAVRERGVRNGAIVSLIGAVQGCVVSVMPKGDPLDDILTTYDQPFEMTGTGEIVDGAVHVHVALGGEDGPVIGHLHSATVRDWFARVYIVPSD